ncbi:MAG: hypothetical protein CMO10_04210 [Thalassospira sp.]|nr:hypothetical protein [Thalassospira sp.]|tara:strand:- start:202 stop:381 length:180 start_codon:yes stop_codon:yes gene_type:complete
MPVRAKRALNYQGQYDVAHCTKSNGFAPDLTIYEESQLLRSGLFRIILIRRNVFWLLKA